MNHVVTRAHWNRDKKSKATLQLFDENGLHANPCDAIGLFYEGDALFTGRPSQQAIAEYIRKHNLGMIAADGFFIFHVSDSVPDPNVLGSDVVHEVQSTTSCLCT